MLLRRQAVRACLCSMMVLSGCQQAHRSGVGDGTVEADVVMVGTTRASLLGLPPEYRALHVGLEACLGGCDVRFSAQPNGEAVATQLEMGNIDFALLTAQEYAEIKSPEKLTLLAAALNPLGKTTRKGLIVAKKGSGITSLKDLENKRFAFGTYRDLLTDVAVQKALEAGGIPQKKLLTEVLPPPLAFEGRLFRQKEVASTIANDITVNAGVIDEVAYASMPDTGGNFITGPSKDQFVIIGETMPVPEMVVVYGPAARRQQVEQVRDYLLNDVAQDELVCRQLGVAGFQAPERDAFARIRELAVGKLARSSEG